MIPVLVIAFNRPELARNQITSIKSLGSPPIFLALDGGRNTSESGRVAAVRRQFEAADFPGGLTVRQAERNLGCAAAVVAGIDWIFSYHNAAIILEDDILVAPTAYPFFEYTLDKYEHDQSIFMISALNQLGTWQGEGSYFLTTGGTWGWATWRQKWQKYHECDLSYEDTTSQDRLTELRSVLPRKVRRVESGYRRTRAGRVDTWDYRWSITRMINEGRSIAPRVNLVTNVGFGARATHNTLRRRLTPPMKDLILPIEENPNLYLDIDYTKRADSRLKSALHMREKQISEKVWKIL